ncbi:hypothetical protein C1645_821375 [Glomus cerebriforme]|uniref:Uncharacterized protein n=1 Tax=Glomus cerebriforme TaxID=658196 RepID=A0A397T0S3_9GLOM|nr:hypothetical protein C1645_821375 [Glomus cerebriforme]
MDGIDEIDFVNIINYEDDKQGEKTDKEVSLNSSGKKSINLPSVRILTQNILQPLLIIIKKKKYLKIQPERIGLIKAAFNNTQSQTKLQTEDYLDEFIANLNSGFYIPSWQIFRNKINDKYIYYKNNIIKLFQENNSKIAFTSNM